MDPDAKLYYRQLLDFGSGVGYKEGKEKYMEEKRERDAQEELRMDNIAMNPNKRFLNNFINDKKIASYQYFDFPEDGEKIDGMILGVPRKDNPKTKYDDDDYIMDFNKLPIDLV